MLNVSSVYVYKTCRLSPCCCLVAARGSFDPFFKCVGGGSLNFDLILNLKAKTGEERRRDNRSETQPRISKVLIAAHISSCCDRAHHLAWRASLSRPSFKAKPHSCITSARSTCRTLDRYPTFKGLFNKKYTGDMSFYLQT